MNYLYPMAILSIAILLLWSCNTSSKTAYVNNFEFFENFKGKVELEARHKHDGQQKQALLDSMKIQLIGMKQSKTADPDKVAIYERQYMQYSNQFETEISTQKAQYTDEIWKQINQYTYEYGKDNDYDYIFGSAGNGSLMYAKEAKDITKEVIAYINKKYEGK